ncbi:unnamed protein product [marine sediment metagenome]|uniref:Uncharacterized protein n=1 Tax=marine sediment metagenome TaxID=412755 RepID=X1TSP1_9ZZZZ
MFATAGKGIEGRQLCYDILVHCRKTAVALKETIRLMEETDETIDAHKACKYASHWYRRSGNDQASFHRTVRSVPQRD